uniref:Secreted protein n=1 Tax=Globodera rostochiensis TaxID=31243 RepID=A0A914H7V6_GLORO
MQFFIQFFVLLILAVALCSGCGCGDGKKEKPLPPVLQGPGGRLPPSAYAYGGGTSGGTSMQKKIPED